MLCPARQTHSGDACFSRHRKMFEADVLVVGDVGAAVLLQAGPVHPLLILFQGCQTNK